MSLSAALLKRVQETKKVAQDEMPVPKYDNMKTPNNHVDGSSNATKEVTVSGLGERDVKHPTADVGTAGKEKRDMEGPKQKAKKMREAAQTIGEQGAVSANPVVRALGIQVSNGILYFHHPNNPEQQYAVPYNDEVRRFVRGAMQQIARNPSEDAVSDMFQLLVDYSERSPDYIAASRGMEETMGDDLPTPRKWAKDVRRSLSGKRPKTESLHKTADGEMKSPSVKHGNPAKTSNIRTKQKDEPENKGNPGTGKEEKGQKKQQFSIKPKQVGKGQNVHKSMKKMHENIEGLEELLGCKLNLKGVK